MNTLGTKQQYTWYSFTLLGRTCDADGRASKRNENDRKTIVLTLFLSRGFLSHRQNGTATDIAEERESKPNSRLYRGECDAK